MKQFKPLFLFLFLGLLLIGCNKGCTTASVMKRESKTVTVQGEKFVITAELIDLRTSRAKSRRNLLNRTVTHSYVVSFNISGAKLNQSDFHSVGVANPDNVDLGNYLKDAHLKLSKDKSHLGVGYGSEVVAVYHFYNGKPLDDMMLMGTGFERDWNAFNPNNFPDIGIAIREKISDCRGLINKDLYHDFMDNVSPSDTLHQVLLSEMSTCQFAQYHYTEQRVRQLSKNKKWRACAVEVLSNYINEDDTFILDEDFKQIVETLNDPVLNAVNDSLLVNEWGQFGWRSSGKTTELIARLNDKQAPIKAELRERVLSDARSELENFTNLRRDQSDLEPDECIRLLLSVGEEELVRTFIDKSLGNVKQYKSSDLIECYWEILEVYPKDIQNQLLAESDRVMKEIKHYNRSRMADYLQGKVDCSKLKQWLEEYPDDIREHDIKDGC